MVSIDKGRFGLLDWLPDRERGSRKGTAARRRLNSSAGVWVFVGRGRDLLPPPMTLMVSLPSPALRPCRSRELSRPRLHSHRLEHRSLLVVGWDGSTFYPTLFGPLKQR
jgi:hypothetical protein